MKLHVTATFTIEHEDGPLAETVLKTVMHDAIDSAAAVIETHDAVSFDEGIDYEWKVIHD